MTLIKRHALLLLIVGFGILVSLLSTSIKTSYQVFFVAMSDDFGLSRGEFACKGCASEIWREPVLMQR